MVKSGKIKHICFDLDGTLINSYQTIYKSAAKALEELKITSALHEAEFRKRIGYHFADIFNELSIPITDVEHFISIYKTFYFDFINDSEFYPDVVNVLETLNQNNIKISLLTTKAQDQADKIIDHFLLKKFFSYIMGRRLSFPHKPSPEPLLFICKELGISADETLMVGDTELDVRCGKSAGAKTCAVTYGYRSREILAKESPDFLISGIKDLLKIADIG